MANGIIINVVGNHYNTLLLKGNEIVEYRKESRAQLHAVGDIYVGRVKRIVPSVNAAFIDIGHDRHGFLHKSDVSPFEREISAFFGNVFRSRRAKDITKVVLGEPMGKDREVTELLRKDQKVIVQVSKEAISSKGPRLSTSIALFGRYLVLLPFDAGVSVSRRIARLAEKKRLKNLLSSISPGNFGVVARTDAEGKSAAVLDEDVKRLYRSWEKIVAAIAKQKTLGRVMSAGSFTQSIDNYLYGADFDKVVVDDEQLYNAIKKHLSVTYPERAEKVYLYSDKGRDIFSYFNLKKKIASLMGREVPLKGGGYLIIEPTEALCSIDVNTGTFALSGRAQEEISLDTNLRAVREVARQIRARGLGGIIAIDLIDMPDPANRRKVEAALRKYLKEDPAKSDMRPIDKFGVLLITRERTRPPLEIEDGEKCYHCYGTGKVQPALDIVALLEREVGLLATKHKIKRKMFVHLHPFLLAYLNRGLVSKSLRWYVKYGKWITLVEDATLSVREYKVFDTQKNLIAVSPFGKKGDESPLEQMDKADLAVTNEVEE